MNFDTFPNSSRVDCPIRVNFILGKLQVIGVNVNTMRIHSGVNRTLGRME